jgi:pSer/pThr/pTyr-binding forkhead associated (FHA) protein
VPEALLALLKLCLLALLYLFFFRVLWAVWNEVRGPKAEMAAVQPGGGRGASKKTAALATRLTMKAPPEHKGKTFDLGRELTIGRAGGCHVSLPDDTFVSQLHARLFQQDGQPYVEDLGSTNGTYLNGRRLSAPSPMRRGDQLQVGSSVMEVS